MVVVVVGGEGGGREERERWSNGGAGALKGRDADGGEEAAQLEHRAGVSEWL